MRLSGGTGTHIHTPKMKKTIKALKWFTMKHSASWNLYDKHCQPNFQENVNSHKYVVPARPSQTCPPTQTSCYCPLTSLRPCSGPETRRLAAWCQTEWVSPELSGRLLPEWSLCGTLHWLCVYLLALLCESEMNNKGAGKKLETPINSPNIETNG